jgi:hypothetical protein
MTSKELASLAISGLCPSLMFAVAAIIIRSGDAYWVIWVALIFGWPMSMIFGAIIISISKKLNKNSLIHYLLSSIIISLVPTILFIVLPNIISSGVLFFRSDLIPLIILGSLSLCTSGFYWILSRPDRKAQ